MPSNSTVSYRLQSIDMLRGLVILIMIIDHIRETFYLHLQLSDPIDISSTEPALYFSRFIAHLCAPVFIFLTGLSAYLYGQKHSNKYHISKYLLVRGLFLVILEITVINFAWTFQFPPHKIFLQVIWAIGLSMIALSALLWLQKSLLLLTGIVIIAGHNLLDSIHFSPHSVFYIPWAISHDRCWVTLNNFMASRTSYPVLPWIGVICVGYYCGQWFNKSYSPRQRHRNLIITSISLLGLFTGLRTINIYGDKSWHYGNTTVETIMSFLNITKYPPSLLFLLITLGTGLFLLWTLERKQHFSILKYLAVFGSVPLFFYIIHLYSLKIMYLSAEYLLGKNKGEYFGFDHVWQLWGCWLFLVLLLYPCVKWFSNYKATHKHLSWLTYL
ncbi:DUF1624 domain-containing protein [Commensalibacter oyaizuii]|uniref:Heparan-alpha-glucosaminide N-acetyltransferase domain-containing protein n=1 Tax=Commensalibacter oyaizuii TaxID=3043873 RepID=A0ABT6Q3V9_9PROT|nr:heparan-alpha-glucosaminide N-acetyltransferase domain-containing protein [Commensalibacter sp. TBRC 16381]MDI2091800.1 heparan-alpha-glucosaminide N-acetyltransferase domain-containing protein [Commensalibacter sp. TBRC 16381]